MGHAKTVKPKKTKRTRKINEPEQEQALEVIDAPAVEEPKHYPKCAYRRCNNLVDEIGYPPFCSRTCQHFHAREQIYFRVNHDKETVKYNPAYASERLWEYLLECEGTHTRARYNKVGDSLVPVRHYRIPSIFDYATYLGVPMLMLRYWSETHEELRQAMLMLRQIQKTYYIEFGSSGVYNGNLTKFLLMNQHGMRERSEERSLNLVGIVKEVYELANSYDNQGLTENPFDETLKEDTRID
jgi:hypothetical protein